MKDGIKVEVYPGDKETVMIQYQEPKEYVKPGQHYMLRSTQAVIDLIQKRGSQENTQIFYLDTPGRLQVQVILDDKILSREQQDFDLATYIFEKSDEVKDWTSLFNNAITQKSLIKFLKRCDPSVFPEKESLLSVIQNFKFATIINGDFTYDDNNNYTFMVKVKDAEGTIRIPNAFMIYVPLLNESDLIVELEIELELFKPKSEDELLGFKLTCPLLDRHMKAAVKYEIEKIRTALPDYNIMAGNR